MRSRLLSSFGSASLQSTSSIPATVSGFVIVIIVVNAAPHLAENHRVANLVENVTVRVRFSSEPEPHRRQDVAYDSDRCFHAKHALKFLKNKKNLYSSALINQTFRMILYIAFNMIRIFNWCVIFFKTKSRLMIRIIGCCDSTHWAGEIDIYTYQKQRGGIVKKNQS